MVNKRKYASQKERLTAKADAEKRRKANQDEATAKARKEQNQKKHGCC